MSETELEKKIQTYAEIAKENPNVDASLLMMSALKQEDAQMVGKSHKLAYWISGGFPPFGLLFALKYYLSGDEEEKHAANMCVILTVISVVGFLIFSKIMFSATGANVQQIQQIKPSDIYQLGQ